MDKECRTVTWFDCDTEVQSGKRFVTKLRCSVCTKLKMKLKGWRNLSERWITGAESVRNSNIRDHAQSDHHECAMNLLKREQTIGSNAPTSLYAPIAKALSTISENKPILCTSCHLPTACSIDLRMVSHETPTE